LVSSFYPVKFREADYLTGWTLPRTPPLRGAPRTFWFGARPNFYPVRKLISNWGGAQALTLR